MPTKERMRKKKEREEAAAAERLDPTTQIRTELEKLIISENQSPFALSTNPKKKRSLLKLKLPSIRNPFSLIDKEPKKPKKPQKTEIPKAKPSIVQTNENSPDLVIIESEAETQNIKASARPKRKAQKAAIVDVDEEDLDSHDDGSVSKKQTRRARKEKKQSETPERMPSVAAVTIDDEGDDEEENENEQPSTSAPKTIEEPLEARPTIVPPSRTTLIENLRNLLKRAKKELAKPRYTFGGCVVVTETTQAEMDARAGGPAVTEYGKNLLAQLKKERKAGCPPKPGSVRTLESGFGRYLPNDCILAIRGPPPEIKVPEPEWGIPPLKDKLPRNPDGTWKYGLYRIMRNFVNDWKSDPEKAIAACEVFAKPEEKKKAKEEPEFTLPPRSDHGNVMWSSDRGAMKLVFRRVYRLKGRIGEPFPHHLLSETTDRLKALSIDPSKKPSNETKVLSTTVRKRQRQDAEQGQRKIVIAVECDKNTTPGFIKAAPDQRWIPPPEEEIVALAYEQTQTGLLARFAHWISKPKEPKIRYVRTGNVLAFKKLFHLTRRSMIHCRAQNKLLDTFLSVKREALPEYERLNENATPPPFYSEPHAIRGVVTTIIDYTNRQLQKLKILSRQTNESISEKQKEAKDSSKATQKSDPLANIIKPKKTDQVQRRLKRLIPKNDKVAPLIAVLENPEFKKVHKRKQKPFGNKPFMHISTLLRDNISEAAATRLSGRTNPLGLAQYMKKASLDTPRWVQLLEPEKLPESGVVSVKLPSESFINALRLKMIPINEEEETENQAPLFNHRQKRLLVKFLKIVEADDFPVEVPGITKNYFENEGKRLEKLVGPRQADVELIADEEEPEPPKARQKHQKPTRSKIPKYRNAIHRDKEPFLPKHSQHPSIWDIFDLPSSSKILKYASNSRQPYDNGETCDCNERPNRIPKDVKPPRLGTPIPEFGSEGLRNWQRRKITRARYARRKGNIRMAELEFTPPKEVLKRRMRLEKPFGRECLERWQPVTRFPEEDYDVEWHVNTFDSDNPKYVEEYIVYNPEKWLPESWRCLKMDAPKPRRKKKKVKKEEVAKEGQKENEEKTEETTDEAKPKKAKEQMKKSNDSSKTVWWAPNSPRYHRHLLLGITQQQPNEEEVRELLADLPLPFRPKRKVAPYKQWAKLAPPRPKRKTGTAKDNGVARKERLYSRCPKPYPQSQKKPPERIGHRVTFPPAAEDFRQLRLNDKFISKFGEKKCDDGKVYNFLHRKLFLFLHAGTCLNPNCHLAFCLVVKDVVSHLLAEKCAEEKCSYPHCYPFRTLATHWRQCIDKENCRICGPVLEKHDHYLNNLGAKVGMLGWPWISEHRPYDLNNDQKKDWHKQMWTEERQMVIFKIASAISPFYMIDAFEVEQYMSIKGHARIIEQKLIGLATSRVNYYDELAKAVRYDMCHDIYKLFGPADHPQRRKTVCKYLCYRKRLEHDINFNSEDVFERAETACRRQIIEWREEERKRIAIEKYLEKAGKIPEIVIDVAPPLPADKKVFESPVRTPEVNNTEVEEALEALITAVVDMGESEAAAEMAKTVKAQEKQEYCIVERMRSLALESPPPQIPVSDPAIEATLFKVRTVPPGYPKRPPPPKIPRTRLIAIHARPRKRKAEEDEIRINAAYQYYLGNKAAVERQKMLYAKREEYCKQRFPQFYFKRVYPAPKAVPFRLQFGAQNGLEPIDYTADKVVAESPGFIASGIKSPAIEASLRMTLMSAIAAEYPEQFPFPRPATKPSEAQENVIKPKQTVVVVLDSSPEATPPLVDNQENEEDQDNLGLSGETLPVLSPQVLLEREPVMTPEPIAEIFDVPLDHELEKYIDDQLEAHLGKSDNSSPSSQVNELTASSSRVVEHRAIIEEAQLVELTDVEESFWHHLSDEMEKDEQETSTDRRLLIESAPTPPDLSRFEEPTARIALKDWLMNDAPSTLVASPGMATLELIENELGAAFLFDEIAKEHQKEGEPLSPNLALQSFNDDLDEDFMRNLEP